MGCRSLRWGDGGWLELFFAAGFEGPQYWGQSPLMSCPPFLGRESPGACTAPSRRLQGPCQAAVFCLQQWAVSFSLTGPLMKPTSSWRLWPRLGVPQGSHVVLDCWELAT